MARIHDLLAAVQKLDPAIGEELTSEIAALTDKRSYGLHWEHHLPEPVEIPSMTPIRGDTVRVLPPRGTPRSKGDMTLWTITSINREGYHRVATLIEKQPQYGLDPMIREDIPLDDLVVVMEPTDMIYPGLVETGRIDKGEDTDPAHVVIKAENLHALKALTFTHHHSIDVIYIDPPYNTGAKDWKYGNDYVDSTDSFRHSKFLSFLEKRLVIAKELLNPDDSVMILTIDEKEYLNVGLLLKQNFPDARIQMISSLIKPGGSSRSGEFGRSNEYIYIVQFGSSHPSPLPLSNEWSDTGETMYGGKINWERLRRTGTGTKREDSPGCFYPIFIRDTDQGPVFDSVGDVIPLGVDRNTVDIPDGATAVFPIRGDGSEGRWRLGRDNLIAGLSKGYIKIGRWREENTTLYYLAKGESTKIENGTIPVVDHAVDGSVIVDTSAYVPSYVPSNQWSISSHDAGRGGSVITTALLGEKRFDFPKSLYAVEDVLRFFVAEKKDAVVLDFFGGSGTTAHAVMRLNKQDDGNRLSITVTNNSVSEKEEKQFTSQGLREGDSEWERYGICDHVTIPRIRAAITGRTPSGDPVTGQYKYNDQFPMSEGISANARFFDLSYERVEILEHGRGLSRISALLWLRSGAVGEIITEVDESGVSVAESYAVVTDPSQTDHLLELLDDSPGIRYVFVITENDHRYESLAAAVTGRGIETVKIPSSYLNTMMSL